MNDTSGTSRRAGKASFDDIYDRTHPTPYFSALKPLEYQVPGHAQPVMRRCVSELRRLRRKPRITVLDLCSGYGMNGALLNYDVSFDDLFDLYQPRIVEATRAERLARDRRFFASRRRANANAHVIGQDVAANALSYGVNVGILDAPLCANLEERPLKFEEAHLVADVDLITVTGGLSYIGGTTFEHLLGALRRPPWVLFFPLRHVPIDDVGQVMSSFGLQVESAPRPLRQRRFKDNRERQAVLSRMGESDLLDDARPSREYLEAALCMARPKADIKAVPLRPLVAAAADSFWRETEIAARERRERPRDFVTN